METLTGVPDKIYKDYEQFKTEHGLFHKHKFLMDDGTKCLVVTKDGFDLKFKKGEPCEYHIIEDLKDDVKKIKHGKPYAGVSEVINASSNDIGYQSDRETIIIREVCIKAAAALCGQSKLIHDWEGVADSMYEWVTGKVLEHNKKKLSELTSEDINNLKDKPIEVEKEDWMKLDEELPF